RPELDPFQLAALLADEREEARLWLRPLAAGRRSDCRAEPTLGKALPVLRAFPDVEDEEAVRLLAGVVRDEAVGHRLVLPVHVAHHLLVDIRGHTGDLDRHSDGHDSPFFACPAAARISDRAAAAQREQRLELADSESATRDRIRAQ